MRDHCAFYFPDDKHHIKIDEPNFPVAKAETGRQVSTEAGAQFLVVDHFTMLHNYMSAFMY